MEPEASFVLEEGQYIHIYEAEVTATDQTEVAQVNVIKKGADIAFDTQAKPVLSVTGEKTFTAGKDIKPGEYVAIGDFISLETYSDNSFDFKARGGDILINNSAIMTLKDGEYVDFDIDAKLYLIDKAPSLTPADGVYKSGMYKVGVHIPAGIYICNVREDEYKGYVTIYKDSKNRRSSELSTTKIEETKEITLVEGQYVAFFKLNVTAKK